jgi:two-component system sensor histidine kinase BaeS
VIGVNGIVSMLRKMNVVLFITFLLYSILLLSAISYLYKFNWDSVFKSYQVNMMETNTYKLMDEMREQDISLTSLNELQSRWVVRRANMYGILIQAVDKNKQTIWIDTITSFDSPDLSPIKEFPYHIHGEKVGYIRVTSVGAYFDLNPVVIEYKQQMSRRSQVLFFSMALVSIGLSLIVARLLSKHLHGLGYFANQIRRGQRDVNIPVRGPEEVRQLAVTLNEMNSELKKQEDWRQHLMEDITHELRTPFTSMLSQLEAIMDGVYEPTKERFVEIYDELDRLSRLANDLESLSEAESARFTLHIHNTNMVQLARRVYQNFLPMAKNKEIKLLFEPTHVPCYAEVDQDKVVQVISNLLSNAIKYTENGGRVTLYVDWKPDFTLIMCEDNGIGIGGEDLPYIFNRLYRVDKSRSRFSGGVGLGLSIVKALVEAHDGKVEVTSELGKGSEFTVLIPNIHKSGVSLTGVS